MQHIYLVHNQVGSKKQFNQAGLMSPDSPLYCVPNALYAKYDITTEGNPGQARPGACSPQQKFDR